MKIIESTQFETQAAKEALNIALLSAQERAAGIEKIKEEEKRRSLKGPRTPMRRAVPSGTSS